MSMFGAINSASSGVALGRTWMDATSDNIANLDTVRPAGEEPFRARMVLAQARPQLAGVSVAAIVTDQSQPAIVHDPGNPLADAEGNVTRPVVDLGEEMTHMMMASRLYQANMSVMTQARDAYQAALQIGRG